MPALRLCILPQVLQKLERVLQHLQGPTAAALQLGQLRWSSLPGSATHTLELQGLQLFCAAAATRGSTWAASQPIDLPQKDLASCHYARIASEAKISIVFSTLPEEDGGEPPNVT